MESLFFLVPIALIFVAVALRILFWAINSGQYDNLDTEAHRILFDEDSKPSSATKEIKSRDDSASANNSSHELPLKKAPTAIPESPRKESTDD